MTTDLEATVVGRLCAAKVGLRCVFQETDSPFSSFSLDSAVHDPIAFAIRQLKRVKGAAPFPPSGKQAGCQRRPPSLPADASYRTYKQSIHISSVEWVTVSMGIHPYGGENGDTSVYTAAVHYIDTIQCTVGGGACALPCNVSAPVPVDVYYYINVVLGILSAACFAPGVRLVAVDGLNPDEVAGIDVMISRELARPSSGRTAPRKRRRAAAEPVPLVPLPPNPFQTPCAVSLFGEAPAATRRQLVSIWRCIPSMGRRDARACVMHVLRAAASGDPTCDASAGVGMNPDFMPTTDALWDAVELVWAGPGTRLAEEEEEE